MPQAPATIATERLTPTSSRSKPVGAENECHLGRSAGKRLRSGLSQVAGAPVCTWLCVR